MYLYERMVNNNTDYVELLKSLEGYMSKEEIGEAIMKGNIKINAIKKAEDEKEEDLDIQEEGEQKAPESSEEEEEMEKGCDKKPAKKIEKSEDEDSEKDKKEDFKEFSKSIDSKFENIESKFSNVEDLQKSVETLTSLVKSLGETINKISITPNQPKTVGNLGVIEKSIGGVKDENGKETYSFSKQKEEIVDVLFKSIETETDLLMKSRLEDELSNIVAGNAVISRMACEYLDKKNVRILQ